jgi:hypothetical protein
MYPRLLSISRQKRKDTSFYAVRFSSSPKKARCLSSALDDCAPLMHHAAYALRVGTNTVPISHGISRKDRVITACQKR